MLNVRYRIEKEIGRGSGGVVYRAYDCLRGVHVALKKLRGVYAGSNRDVFEGESLDVLVRSSHPALPRLTDWGVDEETGEAYYARLFEDGTPLDRLLSEISPTELAWVLASVLDGLRVMHDARFCHGDIKPHNIIVDLEEKRCCLIDFGLSFKSSDSVEIRGTPGYLDPRMLDGEKPGVYSDYYAVGSTLYHVLYGYTVLDALIEKTQGVESQDGVVSSRSGVGRAWVELLRANAPEFPVPDIRAEWTPQDLRAHRILWRLMCGLMSADLSERGEAFQEGLETLAVWKVRDHEGTASWFLGRDAEEQQLQSWMDLCWSLGEKTFCVMEGEEGVGKSALCDVFMSWVRSEGGVVFHIDASVLGARDWMWTVAREVLFLDTSPDQNSDNIQRILLERRDDISSVIQLASYIVGYFRRQKGVIVVDHVDDVPGVLKFLESLVFAVEKSGDAKNSGWVSFGVLLVPTVHVQETLGSIRDRFESRIERCVVQPFERADVFQFIRKSFRGVTRDQANEMIEYSGLHARSLFELIGFVRGVIHEGQSLDGALDCVRERDHSLAISESYALSLEGAKLDCAILLCCIPQGLTLHEVTLLLVDTSHVEAMLHELCVHSVVSFSRGQEGQVYKVYDHVRAHILEDKDHVLRLKSFLVAHATKWVSANIQQRGLLWLGWAEETNSWLAIVEYAPLLLEWFESSGDRVAEYAIRESIWRSWDILEVDILESDRVSMLVALVSLSKETNNSKKGLEYADILIALWVDVQVLSPILLRVFRQTPKNRQENLKLPWAQKIQSIDWYDSSEKKELHGSKMYTDHVLINVLDMMISEKLNGKALGFLWSSLEYIEHSRSSVVYWIQACVRLLPPVRKLFLSITKNLLDVIERVDHEAYVSLLNLHASLCRVYGQEDKATFVYLETILSDYSGELSEVGLRALGNLIELFVTQSNIAVADLFLDFYRKQRNADLIYIHSVQARILTQKCRYYDSLEEIKRFRDLCRVSGGLRKLKNACMRIIWEGSIFNLFDYLSSQYESARYLDPKRFDWAYVHACTVMCRDERALEVMNGINRAGLSLYDVSVLAVCEAEIWLDRGHFDQALSCVDGYTEEEIHSFNPRSIFRLYSVFFYCYVGLERMQDALVELERAEGLVRGESLRQDEVTVLHMRGVYERASGREDLACRALERAQEVLDGWLSSIPKAYQEGFLSTRVTRRVVRDVEWARGYREENRGANFRVMRGLLELVSELYQASERGASSLLQRILEKLVEFTRAERGALLSVDVCDRDDTRLKSLKMWSGSPRLFEERGASVVLLRSAKRGDVSRGGWCLEVVAVEGVAGDGGLGKMSETIMRGLLEDRKPIWTSDAQGDYKRSHSIRKGGMRSILAIPLEDRGGVAGVVYLDSNRESAFSRFDEELVHFLGVQVGPVVRMGRQRLEANDVQKMFPQILGTSPALRTTLAKAAKSANVDVGMLILGNTGTGKTMLAQAIHDASRRSAGPFVHVNCGAIQQSVFLAELFGVKRGAFTGANRDRKGLFEAAHEGTLFLDEVADVPLDVQPALLKALDTKQIRPVGSNRDYGVDVRIVAATNKDLAQMVRDGKFREALYYRLAQTAVRLPDLSERRDDIPALVMAFYNKHLGAFPEEERMQGPSLDDLETLKGWDWKGNVRQLSMVTQSAMIEAQGERRVRLEHFVAVREASKESVVFESVRPVRREEPVREHLVQSRSVEVVHEVGLQASDRRSASWGPREFRALQDRHGAEPRRLLGVSVRDMRVSRGEQEPLREERVREVVEPREGEFLVRVGDGETLNDVLWKVRAKMARDALLRNRYNVAKSARQLGIARRTFYNILESEHYEGDSNGE